MQNEMNDSYVIQTMTRTIVKQNKKTIISKIKLYLVKYSKTWKKYIHE